MFKKVFLITLVSLILFSCNTWAGNIVWDGGGTGDYWSTAANWVGDSLPDANNQAHLKTTGATCIVDGYTISQVVTVEATTTAMTLNIVAGADMVLSQNWGFEIAYAANTYGIVNMTGGEVATTGTRPHTTIGDDGDGELTISGGEFRTEDLDLSEDAGTAEVNLNGGLLYVWGDLTIHDSDGAIDITEGAMLLKGDQSSTISTYITSGWITGYGGDGRVSFTYDSSDAETLVMASDPTGASASGSPGATVYTGPWVDARSYNSGALNHVTIAAAVNDIGSDDQTLLLANGTWNINGSVTIPSNVTLRFESGAICDVAQYRTFTINGHIESAVCQIFSGNGDVQLGNGVKNISPEWWGIDGTADEVQINTAISAADNNPFVILQPNKIYTIAASITPTDGLTLAGHGKGTKIETSVSGLELIDINNVDDVTISDLWLYGASTSIYNDGLIWIRGTSSYCVIKNCFIEHTKTGIELDTGTSRNTIIGCEFYDIGLSDGSVGYGVIAANSHENIISENGFDEVRRHCVYLSNAASHNIVSNNIMEGAATEAIGIYASYDYGQNPCLYNKITTNHIKDCEDGIILSQRVGYTVIANNIFEDINNKAISIEGHQDAPAITDSPYHINVIGNNINQAAVGIKVLNGTYVSIADNVIDGVTNRGILLTFAGSTASCYVKYCTVVDNIINGDSATYGIDMPEWSNGQGFTMTGNIVTGCTYEVRVVDAGTGDLEIPNATTDNIVGHGTAAPTSGTWKQGDIMYDTTPSANGNVGWICTTAGTPGTWKLFGSIDN